MNITLAGYCGVGKIARLLTAGYVCIALGSIPTHADQSGVTATPSRHPSQPVSADVRNLLDRVSSLPVEYRADLTFSLLNQFPDVVPNAYRANLLRDIFEKAPQAHYAAPLSPGIDDSTSVAFQEALTLSWLHADALELQLRALDLLHLNPARRLELFRRVSIAPSHTTCDDASVPNFYVYYQQMASVLGSLPENSLPDGTRRETYLSDALRNAGPSQLVAFLRNYTAFNLGTEWGDVVREQFNSALSSVTPSDREMTALVGSRGDMTSLIQKLLKTPEYAGRNGAALLAAYRTFLIAGLHNKACSDTSLDRHAIASKFNALALDLIGEDPKPVQVLTPQDLSPTGVAAAPKFDQIMDYRSQTAQLSRLFKVMVANQKRMATFAQDDNYIQPEPADVNSVLRFAIALSETAAGNDLSRYENCQSVFNLLIGFLPPGPSFRDTVDAEASFLNLNEVEVSNPPAWLREFKHLIFISRKPTEQDFKDLRAASAKGEIEMLAPSPDSGFIIDTLKRYDSDPVISAYVMYEQVFKPPYVTTEKASHIW